jgi:hypothetical protein
MREKIDTYYTTPTDPLLSRRIVENISRTTPRTNPPVEWGAVIITSLATLIILSAIFSWIKI